MPGIAGVVIEALTAPIALTLDALSFVVSAVALLLIRRTEELPARLGQASLLSEAREGLSVVFTNRLLRSIAGCTATSNFFNSATVALWVLFATRELGLGAAEIGVVFALGNGGALVGTLSASRIARWIGVGPTIVGSAVVFGLGGIPVALATPALAMPLLILSSLLISLGSPVYNINQVSFRQSITPQRLQGRMNATMRFLVWGTMPLGALAGGVAGEVLGLRGAIALAAVGGLTAFLWVLFSPVRALERIPEPVD